VISNNTMSGNAIKTIESGSGGARNAVIHERGGDQYLPSPANRRITQDAKPHQNQHHSGTSNVSPLINVNWVTKPM